MTWVRGDPNARHNIPNEPMLNPLGGGGGPRCRLLPVDLAPAGLVLAAAVVVTSLLSGYFSIEAPQSYRTMDSMQPLLLMAGLGLRQFVAVGPARPLRRTRPCRLDFGLARAGRRAGRVELFPGAVPAPERWTAFSGTESAIGREYRACPPGTRALLRADWADSYSFRFLAFPYEDYAAYQPARDLLPADVRGFPRPRPHLLFRPGRAALRDTLQRFFPLGTYHATTERTDRRLLEFPCAGLETQQGTVIHSGLTGRYYGDGGDDDGVAGGPPIGCPDT